MTKPDDFNYAPIDANITDFDKSADFVRKIIEASPKDPMAPMIQPEKNFVKIINGNDAKEDAAEKALPGR